MGHSKEVKKTSAVGLGEALRCPRGAIDVRQDFDPGATPLFPGKGHTDAAGAMADLESRLDDLQERLYAASRGKSAQADSLLLVLQGMDTAGKGGVVRHVIGLVDPQGVTIKAFKQPTAEEKQHDFLWRIERALPAPGMIGIFDRSHYEDVLVGRVDALASADEIEARYASINRFEQRVADSGTRIVKCFLNVSYDEQKRRLEARLDDPTKYWKYNPGDLAVRAKWDDYMAAYGLALTRCNEGYAPWHVIPSDHKWYRNWAITQLLVDNLAAMNPTWPPAAFDVAAEKARLLAS